MAQWIEVCASDAIAAEDVICFDHAGKTHAIYRSPDDKYFATDGLSTHENVHLAEGFVSDDRIECAKYYKTGEVKGPPACIDLKTYPTRVDDRISLRTEEAQPLWIAACAQDGLADQPDGMVSLAPGGASLSAGHKDN
jgi:3-phenylpropionate/trans-cinnamate dioxygenase ferredoxin subunit